MNPLPAPTEKKPTPVVAVCPHCNTPIKFSVVGLLRKTYSCPTCQTTSTHGLRLPGPLLLASMVILPLILVGAARYGALQTLTFMGICPHCLDTASRLLFTAPFSIVGILLNIAVVATLAQSHRTLSQLP